MSRPFTDIAKINTSSPIKNGTMVVGALKTGYYNTNNRYVLNTPAIESISNKYGYRFYNGIFFELVGNQVIVGG